MEYGQGRKELKTFCERELAPFRTRVYTPESGEVLDVSAGSGAYQVVLTDSLMEATHMRVMTDAQLGWLRAILGPVKEVRAPPAVSLHSHYHHRGSSYLVLVVSVTTASTSTITCVSSLSYWFCCYFYHYRVKIFHVVVVVPIVAVQVV